MAPFDLPPVAPPGLLFPEPPPGPTLADWLTLFARVGDFVASLFPWLGS